MKPTLFIHIPRTAGTSMNRHAEKYIPGFQELSYSLRPTCKLDSLWTSTEHISVGSLIDRNVFSGAWYLGRFRFAFVRNPWDRLVSLYEHLRGYRLTQKRQRESNAFLCNFTSFIEALVSKDFVKPLGKLNGEDWSQANPQTEWLRWGIDFIGRYENLDADWERLCKTIGMTHNRLERHKRSERKGSFRDYYTERTRWLVRDKYREEIDTFEYDCW